MKRRTRILLPVLIGLALTLLILGRLFRMSVVVGQSMEPTLETWDYCLSRRVGHYQPRRGDIVTFRTADDPPLYFIKRVIALPGETVAIDRGVVEIDGRPLPEPYTIINPTWTLSPLRVPAGNIYVLSDHRASPQADYVQGLVALRLVESRLVWHWRWKPWLENMRWNPRPAPPVRSGESRSP